MTISPMTACGEKHHILSHLGRTNLEGRQGPSNSTAVNISENNAVDIVSSTLTAQKLGSSGLLPTVVVRVGNSPVKNDTARFLLDSGSQIHIFTVKGCKRLGISCSKNYLFFKGTGDTTQAVKGLAKLIISSQYDEEKVISLRTLIVEKKSENLPRLSVATKDIGVDLSCLPLADKSSYQS
ncbi:hypothetical protein JTB14_017559 [Gonioctena quinquepunctata]|nr:hypothetical protein JTB14_017559 [Gonioctena quinquepunctata]